MLSIKEVSIDEEKKQIHVSGSHFAIPEQVWFRTKDKKIMVFMRKVRFSIFQFYRHPMVEELADLRGLEDW